MNLIMAIECSLVIVIGTLPCCARDLAQGPPAAPTGPALVVATGVGVCATEHLPDTTSETAAVAAGLVVAGLPERDVEALRGCLDDLTHRLRATAFDVDFDDSAVDAEIQEWLGKHRPSWTAAQALAPLHWCSADHDVSVAWVPQCPPSSSKSCRPIAGPAAQAPQWAGDGPTLAGAGLPWDRANFLAWAVASSVRLPLEQHDTANVLAALRHGASLPGTRIALVLDAAVDLQELSAVATAARLALRASGSRAPGALLALARCDNPAVQAWLHTVIPAGTVLVVPRLSSLVEIDAFRQEVAGQCSRPPPGATDFGNTHTRLR